jgi:DNA-binding transcriptional regulator WhiA
MSTFLFVISFICHLISFFFIILLSLKLSKVKELEKKQTKMMKDMEEAIATYLLEFKEENEKFIGTLTKTINRVELQHKKEERRAVLPTYLPNIEQIKDQVDISTTHITHERVSSDKDTEMNNELQSLMQQALQLHKQGKTIEEIARILEKGKTEIELLLKFRQM